MKGNLKYLSPNKGHCLWDPFFLPLWCLCWFYFPLMNHSIWQLRQPRLTKSWRMRWQLQSEYNLSDNYTHFRVNKLPPSHKLIANHPSNLPTSLFFLSKLYMGDWSVPSHQLTFSCGKICGGFHLIWEWELLITFSKGFILDWLLKWKCGVPLSCLGLLFAVQSLADLRVKPSKTSTGQRCGWGKEHFPLKRTFFGQL